LDDDDNNTGVAFHCFLVCEFSSYNNTRDIQRVYCKHTLDTPLCVYMRYISAV